MEGAFQRLKRRVLNRDPLLILWGLLLSLISIQYFVDSGKASREQAALEDKIGFVSERAGDVRLKTQGMMYWRGLSGKPDIFLNDSVFTGENSSTELTLGSSKLRLNSNSMVVLRKFRGGSGLELSLGGLSAQLGKGETVTLLFPGQPAIEMKAGEATEVTVTNGPDGRPTVQPVKGRVDVKINNRVVTVGPQESLDVKSADAAPKARPLAFSEPVQNEEIYSSRPEPVKFKWTVPGGPSDLLPKLRLELSEDPRFEKIFHSADVSMRNEYQHQLKSDREFYYRLKTPTGEESPTQRLAFFRVAELKVRWTLLNQDARQDISDTRAPLAEARFSRDARSLDAWIQIARDRDFEDIAVNERTALETWTTALAPGVYWARARSMYPREKQGQWTSPQKLEIRAPELKAPVWPLALTRKILLDAASYPPNWASLPAPDLQVNLQSAPHFRDFFLPLRGLQNADARLEIQSSLSDEPVVLPGPFPGEWIRPGVQTFRLRQAREDRTTPWSEPRPLEIVIAPPRWVPQTVTTRAPAESESFSEPVAWTPSFFSARYEIEAWSSESSVERWSDVTDKLTASIRVGRDQVKTVRVRGLDESNRPVTGWSEPLPVRPPVPARALAHRAPAQDNNLATKATPDFVPWKFPADSWMWFGSGLNYVNYQQDVPGRTQFDFQEVAGPSFYAEYGRALPSGWGAIGSYKQTPGSVQIENAAVDSRSYLWTTFSAELQKRAKAVAHIMKGQLSYSALLGVQYHTLPFLHFVSGNEFSLRENSMLTGSMGFLTQLQKGRWRYDWQMRYQHPFATSTSSASAFAVTPQFAFDGSVGASYAVLSQWRLGAYWYGQWHSYDFTYQGNDAAESGSQSLFYSNFDLRLGYEF